MMSDLASPMLARWEKILTHLDHGLARFEPALYAEAEDGAEKSVLEVLLGGVVGGMARQTRVVDPGDLRVLVQKTGDLPAHSGYDAPCGRQRLDTQQNQERVEWAETQRRYRACLGTGLDDVGDVDRRRRTITESVIAGIGIGDPGSALKPSSRTCRNRQRFRRGRCRDRQ